MRTREVKLKPCACGCGTQISSKDKRGRDRYYFPRHHFKGKKHSQESRRKISEGHKGLRKGEKNNKWKGGKRYLNRGLYIGILKPEHPLAHKSGYVYEHRLVWEEYHKANLLPWAVVHHVDGDTRNNNIDNLLGLSSNAEHRKIHTKNKNTTI